MKVSREFVLVAAVCVVPFGLAIHQDLKGSRGPVVHDGAGLGGGLVLDGEHDDDRERERAELERQIEEARFEATFRRDSYPDLPADPDPDPAPPPTPVVTGQITADDLLQIVGPLPATMGPLLDGVAIGAPSTSFLPEPTRARIEAFKLDHQLDVDFDFDDVALNGVTARILGDEPALRAALTARWGPPRELMQDSLVWLGTGPQRAVYSGMSDGVELRFETYTTIDAVIAPNDKRRLGVEPFAMLGTTRAKVEGALGSRLQDTGSDDVVAWALPGIGAGAGKTMVEVTFVDDRVDRLVIEGATDETQGVRDACVVKWGRPTEDQGVLTWTVKGTVYELEVWSHGFSLAAARR